MNQNNRLSVFSMLEGLSSNNNVATANVDNARVIQSMPPQNMTLDVRQTARGQVNTGSAMNASEQSVDAGNFSFSIEAGGRSHNFTIEVGENDDNETIQNRMAEAINSRNIGVTATVEEDEGASTLSLASSTTGTDSAFTVTDTSGNLAETMGIDTVSREAQNAVFSVNNRLEQESQTNDVSLAAGVTATLQGTGRTNISFERDTEAAVNAARSLVDSINNALGSTNSRDGRGSARFVNDIQGMNATFSASLERVGINVAGNGRLSIDTERLERAAGDGSLERLLSNQNSGFMARVERIGNNAAHTNQYRNAPEPVNIGNSSMNFNFNNMNNMWSMFNLFA
jgi:flagellar hook-associated protein 2